MTDKFITPNLVYEVEWLSTDTSNVLALYFEKFKAARSRNLTHSVVYKKPSGDYLLGFSTEKDDGKFPSALSVIDTLGANFLYVELLDDGSYWVCVVTSDQQIATDKIVAADELISHVSFELTIFPDLDILVTEESLVTKLRDDGIESKYYDDELKLVQTPFIKTKIAIGKKTKIAVGSIISLIALLSSYTFITPEPKYDELINTEFSSKYASELRKYQSIKKDLTTIVDDVNRITFDNYSAIAKKQLFIEQNKFKLSLSEVYLVLSDLEKDLPRYVDGWVLKSIDYNKNGDFKIVYNQQKVNKSDSLQRMLTKFTNHLDDAKYKLINEPTHISNGKAFVFTVQSLAFEKKDDGLLLQYEKRKADFSKRFDLFKKELKKFSRGFNLVVGLEQQAFEFSLFDRKYTSKVDDLYTEVELQSEIIVDIRERLKKENSLIKESVKSLNEKIDFDIKAHKGNFLVEYLSLVNSIIGKNFSIPVPVRSYPVLNKDDDKVPVDYRSYTLAIVGQGSITRVNKLLAPVKKDYILLNNLKLEYNNNKKKWSVNMVGYEKINNK
ncbi:hypothetical protein [Photobacterium leiognathi]|uniref:hypothetical protein n=1 Tax=Photobacterium leiognathi TaxID=553611 RepID=UPI002982010C|nr:hypothetical protein [Photobacterium leiognathi]